MITALSFLGIKEKSHVKNYFMQSTAAHICNITNWKQRHKACEFRVKLDYT